MSMKYLGETLDIHAGGEDLIFPHHENEIAQSEAATGKPFANYWLHIGFLQIRGEKMSKSLGNFLTAREVVKRHKPEAVRLFFLQKHYRSPINYTEEILAETESALDRLLNTLKNIVRAAEDVTSRRKVDEALLESGEKELLESAQEHKAAFIENMEDDFNTAGALGHLFDLAKMANRILEKGEKTAGEQEILRFIYWTFMEFDIFLGLFDVQEEDNVDTEAFNQLMDLLLSIRADLRAQKLWDLADKIRNQLQEIGIQIEDRKEGTGWKKIAKKS